MEERKGIYGAKMKVIGVGGGGCNMINHMIREGFTKTDVELMVANTERRTTTILKTAWTTPTSFS